MRHAFLCGLLALPVIAVASTISVHPLSIAFSQPNQRYEDIQVYNTGKSTAYVNVELKRLINPGAQHVRSKLFHDNPEAFGMIVSPNKLIIPAAQSRVVRVLRLLQGNKKEAVYQINIAPAEGVLERIKTGNKKVQAGIRVIVGYNVIARVLPNEPRANLVIKRQGKTLTVENKGNASALLYRGEVCENQSCKALPTKRMYAGLSWSTEMPYAAPAHYTERFMGVDTKRLFN